MRAWTTVVQAATAPLRWALRVGQKLVSTLNDPAEWLVQMFGGGRSHSGVNVDEKAALGVAAVFACVRVISEDLASLPLEFVETTPEGRRPAPDYYLTQLFDQPNPEQHAGEFVEMLTGHLELRGNSYAEIEWSDGGAALALWPLHPDRVGIFRLRGEGGKPGALVYRITLPQGQTSEWGNVDYLPANRVFHLRGLSSDGVVGLSPLDLHREAIGLAIALERHGATFFGAGAQLGGVLETDKTLSDKAYARLEKYLESHAGLQAAHRNAILEEGLKWKQIGLQSDHAQFLESRKYQRSEIAAIFRVPLHKIQDLDRSTNNNIEHQGIEYVVDCMRPTAVRWELTIRRCLMSAGERARFRPKFNLAALLRGDMKSRYDAYAVGRQWGWLSADDVRELEDLNPLPNGQGKLYMVPSNMQPADQVSVLPKPAPTPPAAPPELPPGRSLESIEAAFRRVYEEAIGRLVRKEAARVSWAARKIGPEGLRAFDSWVRDFYRDHEAEVRGALQPVALALAEAAAGHERPGLAQFASEAARVAAAAHCRRALQELADAVRSRPTTPVDAVLAVTERWAAGAAREAAEREVSTALIRLQSPPAASA